MFSLNSVIKIVTIERVRTFIQIVPNFPKKHIRRDQDATTGCYHGASKTQVIGSFKMTPIHASVIYEDPLICCIHEFCVSSREHSDDAMLTLSDLNYDFLS